MQLEPKALGAAIHQYVLARQNGYGEGQAMESAQREFYRLAALKAQEPVAVGYISDAGLRALKERGLVSIYRTQTKVCHIPVSVNVATPGHEDHVKRGM